MSSGDENSKDQQVCQTSTWLHFSLQTGGTTTHYSHDKGTPKGEIFPRAAMRFNRGHPCERMCSSRSYWPRGRLRAACRQDVLGVAILLTQSVWANKRPRPDG